MVHKVVMPKEVYVEEYYVLRGIYDTGVCKRVIKEKEFKDKPTVQEIAKFLDECGAHFASVENNYRLLSDELPF